MPYEERKENSLDQEGKKREEAEDQESTSLLGGEKSHNMENMEEEKKDEEATSESVENGEEGDKQSLEELKHNLEALQKEKEDLMNKLMRLQADFDNYRKRMKAEKGEVEKFANFEFMKKILPVIDNLERALTSAEKSDDGVIEGLEMILRQFKEVLESEGVTAISSAGKAFDPALHEAVLTEESEDFSPGTVIEELQKGYLMKDKVLRPSMVKVAVEKKDSTEDQNEEENSSEE